MDKFKKDFDEEIKKYTNDSCCYTQANENVKENTLTIEELNRILDEFEKNKPESNIQEICITKFIFDDKIHIILNKYMCMNRKTYEFINEKTNNFMDGSTNFIIGIYSIPIYHSDERYKKYMKELYERVFKEKYFDGKDLKDILRYNPRQVRLEDDMTDSNNTFKFASRLRGCNG